MNNKIINIIKAKISFFTLNFMMYFLIIENFELSIISLTIQKNQKKPLKIRLFCQFFNVNCLISFYFSL